MRAHDKSGSGTYGEMELYIELQRSNFNYEKMTRGGGGGGW